MPEFRTDVLAGLLGPFLSRQRWFERGDLGLGAPSPVRVADSEVLREGRPGLVWLAAEAGATLYQLLVGIRSEADADQQLRRRESAVLGLIEDGSGPAVAYDALVDPELAVYLLGVVTGGGETASRVRHVGSGRASACLVFDERLVLKLFRRLEQGPNLHVEVALALDEAGFNHLPAPITVWRREERELGLVQEFLAGGTTGWSLAMASLRDLYASGASPEKAGADFGPEARRLGEMTARLHMALERAFGSEPGDPESWRASVARQLAAINVEGDEVALEVLDALETVEDPGRATRVHGDFHLGQVMRTEVGWFAVDLSGDPAHSVADRRARASPLRDVAAMLRSFEFATAVASRERGPGESDVARLAEAWDRRNRAAFLGGYLGTPGIERILPEQPESFDPVLAAFELERAAIELAYELSHRPWRSGVPRRAMDRLLARGERPVPPGGVAGRAP